MPTASATRRGRQSLLAIAALASVGLASSARATLENGNFGTGTFSGWTTTGIASIETAASIGEPTTGGNTYQALIQTSTLTGSPISVTGIDSFLGTTPTLANYPNAFVSGSAFEQTFTAAAGSTLSFDFNFLTDQPTDGTGNPDEAFAFLLLGGIVANTDPGLDQPFNAVELTNSADTTFKNESGYSTYTFPSDFFPVDGTYTLGFAVLTGSAVSQVVTDARTLPPDSGLLVDNVSLSSSVPEPAALSLMALASSGLLLRGRRRSEQGNQPWVPARP